MARTFHDHDHMDRPAISRRRQERTEATRRRLALPRVSPPYCAACLPDHHDQCSATPGCPCCEARP